MALLPQVLYAPDAVAVARLMEAEFSAEIKALAREGLAVRWTDSQVQNRLSEAFVRSGGALDVVKIKVFDATGRIIYSCLVDQMVCPAS